MSLDGGTGRYLRPWSREQFKWQEGKKIRVFLTLWLGNVYLDKLDCFIRNSQNKVAPGTGDGGMAPHHLQGYWAG